MNIYVIARKKETTQESIGRLLFYGYNKVVKKILAPDTGKTYVFDHVSGKAPSADFQYEVNILPNKSVNHVYLCIATPDTTYYSSDAIACCDYLVYEDKTGVTVPDANVDAPVMAVEEIKYSDDNLKIQSRSNIKLYTDIHYKYNPQPNGFFTQRDCYPTSTSGSVFQRAFTRAVMASNIFEGIMQKNSGNKKSGSAVVSTNIFFDEERPDERDLEREYSAQSNNCVYAASDSPVYVMFSKDVKNPVFNHSYTTLNFDYDYFPRHGYDLHSMDGFYDMLACTANIGIIGKACPYYSPFRSVNDLIAFRNNMKINKSSNAFPFTVVSCHPQLITISAMIESVRKGSSGSGGVYISRDRVCRDNNIGTISLMASCLNRLGFSGDIDVINTQLTFPGPAAAFPFRAFGFVCWTYNIALK